MKRFAENYLGIPPDGGDWLNSAGTSLLAWWLLPVLALASRPISASIYMWVALALLILIGGWAIRWTTEQKWGRYSNA